LAKIDAIGLLLSKVGTGYERRSAIHLMMLVCFNNGRGAARMAASLHFSTCVNRP